MPTKPKQAATTEQPKRSSKSSKTEDAFKAAAKRAKAVPTTLVYKHGNGLDAAHVEAVEDAFARQYREHRMSMKYTKKDIALTVMGTVIFMFVAHIFTQAWYGF